MENENLNEPEKPTLKKTDTMLSLTFLFAQWLGENQYTKHQVNDRWYDDVYFIGSTEHMWKLFQTDVDWIEHKKTNNTKTSLEAESKPSCLGVDMAWISVKDKLPEIIEDDYSDEVLCVGHKGTHPNEDVFVRYEIMRWKKLSESEQVLNDWMGKKIKYGWSNRWWDTNPDLYNITHWAYLKPPRV
jgi:hypothetical protein